MGFIGNNVMLILEVSGLSLLSAQAERWGRKGVAVGGPAKVISLFSCSPLMWSHGWPWVCAPCSLSLSHMYLHIVLKVSGSSESTSLGQTDIYLSSLVQSASFLLLNFTVNMKLDASFLTAEINQELVNKSMQQTKKLISHQGRKKSKTGVFISKTPP